ncbi:MAG TPA: RHS repeat-associated core domain-containing protein [Thermoanaerobaculia bacterium]|nr:RHS repeat-associated core domain-containing protein [Thermoanaerobaculia bacterium]
MRKLTFFLAAVFLVLFAEKALCRGTTLAIGPASLNSLCYIDIRIQGAEPRSIRMGRFLSVDPVVAITQAVLSPQRWNRYAYVSNNPLKNVDPDGRAQVTFGDKRTEIFFKRLEARHAQVRATLGRYRGAGTPDLHIQRGSAGLDIDGKTKAKGEFKGKYDPRYDVDKIVSSGAKQDDSALLPATGKFLSGSVLLRATLTIDDSVTPGSKHEQSVALHELGHAEGAAANTDRYLALGANDVIMVDGQLTAHDDRPLEKEAEAYKDIIEPPHP